jgi:hypothetical protein
MKEKQFYSTKLGNDKIDQSEMQKMRRVTLTLRILTIIDRLVKSDD